MIVSIHLRENKCFCMKDTYYVTGSSRGGMVDTDEQIIAMAQPAIYINFKKWIPASSCSKTMSIRI